MTQLPTEKSPVEIRPNVPKVPFSAEVPQHREKLQSLFAPENGKKIVSAAETKAIGSETFQRLSHARVKAADGNKIAAVNGAKKLVSDNLTFRLKVEDIPVEYHPYLSSHPVQLAMSLCEDIETFEKFVHLTAVSLTNAETAARSRLDQTDRETRESFPAIGKRLTRGQEGYRDQVARKCKVLDVLSRRYAMTEVEGDVSVIGVLKEAAQIENTEGRRTGADLRKVAEVQETDVLLPPERRPTAPSHRLFPLQQRAFDGTDIFEGMLPYFKRTDIRGAMKKTFALILPTGVGKTVTAAELVGRLYHRGIQKVVENGNGARRNEAFVEQPPALLFVAPQRVLVTQAAKELHGYLSDLYEIQMDSSIITGGRRKETKWAFIQKAVAPYKQEVVMRVLSGEVKIPEKSSLAGKPKEDLYTLLLSHWEEVMELSDYLYLDVRGRGEIATPQEVLIHDLRRLARENGIIDDNKIKDKFTRDAHTKITKLGEDVKMQKAAAVKIWNEVRGLFIPQGNGENGSGDQTSKSTQLSEITTTYVFNRLAARWTDVLSPFHIDDPEVNALRSVVKKLGISVPSMYKDLVDLTLECQNGMIRKPDPQDYTFQHLQYQEAEARRNHSLPAAFSTIQALYNRERLESVLEDLSDHGKRKVVVIFDEAHHIGGDAPRNTEVFSTIMANPNVETVIGMTASEVRADGQRVTDFFERSIYKATLLEAVDSGRLQKFTYTQPQADTSGLSVSQVSELSSKKAEKSRERLTASVDDLVERVELIEKVRRGELLIDQVFPGISAEDRKLWEDGLNGYWARQILGFCNDIPSATFVKERLRQRGVTAETIFGDTPTDERNRILNAYKKGELNSLILVGVGREGLDLPQTTVGVLFGSIGSAVTLQQMFGRFLRRRQGPPTLILDYSVPSSQEYHAELLRRQFAVDVVGQPPKEPMPSAKRAKAAEAGAPAEKGADLLATINVSPDQIKLTGAKVFTPQHIELVPVVPSEEVNFAVAAPAPEAKPAVQPEVAKAEEIPELPFITPTIEFQLPKPERLQILLDKDVKVEADITRGVGENAQLLGKSTLRKVEEGVELGLNVYVSEEFNLADAVTVQQRLQASIPQDWMASFAALAGRGRGMMVLPDGTEARIGLEGRTLSFTVKMPVSNLVPSQQQTAQALSALLKSAIAQEGEFVLNSDLHARVEDLLHARKVRLNIPIGYLSQANRIMRESPFIYCLPEERRNELRLKGEKDWDKKQKWITFNSETPLGNDKFKMEIWYNTEFPRESPDNSKVSIKTEYHSGKVSVVDDYDFFQAKVVLLEKLKLLGFSDVTEFWSSPPHGELNISYFQFSIPPTPDNKSVVKGLFYSSQSLPLHVEVNVHRPYSNEIGGVVEVDINPFGVEQGKTGYTDDELINYIKGAQQIVELVLDDVLSPVSEIDINIGEFTQSYQAAGLKEYQVEHNPT